MAVKLSVRLLALALLLSAPASAGRAPPPIEGPVDDTIKEVVLSLEASAVSRIPLDKYALFALDAVADYDRCLGRKGEGAEIVLTCGQGTLRAAWPPKNGGEVAQLLSNTLRLVDPERTIRPDRKVAVARALARAVDDPFTAYLPPDVVARLSAGNKLFTATPGVEVWPRQPTKVREVRRGSDAARSNIHEGDTVVAIDGQTTAHLTFPELSARLQGPNETGVRLRIRSADGTERDVMLTRTQLPESDIVHAELSHGVVYIHLPVFKQGSAQQISNIIWDGRPTGVILDLRNNGGGLVPEGIAIADLFLRDGVIASVKSGPGRPQEEFLAKKDPRDYTEPLVLLVDSGSASASELLTMILKERRRAIVLGTSTAGKGSVQRQIHLPDGGVLKVTAGYYYGPLGGRLGETGVEPDRALAPPSSKTVPEGGDPERDSWILSALDVLQGASRDQQTVRSGIGPDP